MAVPFGTRRASQGLLANEIVKLLLGGHMSSAEMQDTASPNDQSPVVFETSLVALIPDLRAFATMLCRNRELAEDLAQEALVKAWRAQSSFEAGGQISRLAFVHPFYETSF